MTSSITLKGIKEIRGFIMRQLAIIKLEAHITDESLIRFNVVNCDVTIEVKGTDDKVEVECVVKNETGDTLNVIKIGTIDGLLNLSKNITRLKLGGK
ncbi:hypothetical protein [Bacillus phage SRT01hs]|uniref:Uncharacterized protein n=1 Tax=Bacillus phage SRT01hs TaxID=2847044 RepID=A0A6B9SW11_9CAUD|nr:hypothetical protein H3022_gp02 [Bacillus phage SRT01hs]QHJ75860.1 hypothetical protein [Bacillus phage SRT01hs]